MKTSTQFWERYAVSLLLGGILLVAFILRAYGNGFGLPSIYYVSDEVVIVEHALKMGTGDLNPHYFLWPANFHMYLMLLFYGIYFMIGKMLGIFASAQDFALAYWTDPSPFYLIGRYFSAILGTATVGLVYLVGKRYGGKRVGLLAALFLACNFEHTRFSHNAKVDILVTFLIFLAFVRVLKILDRGHSKDYILAGFLVGLGIASKYIAALMVIPIFLAHLLGRMEHNPFRLGLLLHKKLIAAYVAVFSGFFLGAPYFFLSPSESRTWLETMFRYGREGLLGNNYYGNSYLYLFTDVLRYAFGITMMILVLGGVLYAVYKHTKPLVLLLAFPIIYMIQIGQMRILQLRHINPALPFLVLLGAIFFETISTTIFSKIPGKRYWIALVVAVLMVSPLYNIVTYTKRVFLEKDTRILAKEWIEANIPAGSKIARDVYWTAPPIAENKKSLERMYQAIAQNQPGHGTRYKARLEIPNELFPPITYDIVDVFTIAGILDQTPAEYFRSNTFDYVVIASYYYRRFYEEGAFELHEEEVLEGRAFYELLEQRGTLIQVFEPPEIIQKQYWPRRYLELPSTIKIYKLDDSAES